MQAVILAAGRGSRLLPLTHTTPKPLIPFMSEAVIDRILQGFLRLGVENYLVLVDYRKERLIQHLEKWREKVKIEIRDNNIPFGTAGAVRRNLDLLEQRFFVSSSDLVTDINLKRLLDFHHERGSKLTVAFSESDEVSHYGIATLDENARLTRFVEKPRESEAFSRIVNAGIYVVEREVLEHVPDATEFDFSRHLFPLLVDKNYPIFGYKFREYWNDIGRHSSYLFAIRDAVNHRVSFNPGLKVKEFEKGVLYFSDSAEIGEVEVEGFVVAGKNVVIRDGCKLSNTVIWDEVKIGENTSISETIIAENVELGKNCKVMPGVVIGSESRIGDGCVLGQNLKLWCGTTVNPGTFLVGE
ncbi:MAG: NDP-sugar synthase [Thermoplasmata archaeon]|nr:NDP-sugar synthase [Thermoplasmata archaeon]